MFLKKCDFISPPITLFFKGESSHTSIYSGILSIIVIIIVANATIYYAYQFIQRINPKAYFFTRYVEDAGIFPLNSTQMFHFIQVTDPDNNQKIPLDFQAFRIIGFDDVYADDYMNDGEIAKIKNHWIYGNCNNDSDTKGISYLITHKNFEQSACIRKYYDASKRKYFNTGEEGFRWPVIKKGCSNPERTYYGIIMQRCDKATEFIKEQGPECKSSSEIELIIKKSSLSFQIIDHYADMLNYEMPLTKYFYELATGFLVNHYHVQNLNFNPASMLTHNGIFFDNEVKEEAYIYTQNEKQTVTEQELNKDGKSTNGCLIAIYFWMQNTLQYYERHYDRAPDVLSNIGGISSIVFQVVSILNLLVHNFIVILDTEEIALDSEQKNNKNSKKVIKNTRIIRKTSKLNSKKSYQPGMQSINELQQQPSSNYEEIRNVETNYQKEISNENKKVKLKRNSINNFKSNLDGNNMMNNVQNSRGYFKSINQNYLDGNYGQKRNTQREDTTKRIIIEKKEKKDENENENENKPLEKQNFNWCNYLGYLICCEKTNKNMSYYKEFRARLISEENIIQNYMDVYKNNEYIKNKVSNKVE
jgi:hypothetical protein